MRVGLGKGLPPGYAEIRLSPCLTPQETRLIRKDWREILDANDVICPHVVYQNLTSAVKHELRQMHGTILRGKKLSLSVSAEFPEIKVIVTAVDEETEEHYVLPMKLYPAFLFRQLPCGLDIKSPFPKELPLGIKGHQIKDKLCKKMERGEPSLYYIVELGPTVGDKFRFASPSASVPVLWSLCLQNMEESLLRECLKEAELQSARTIVSDFENCQRQHGDTWATLSHDFLVNAMLWMIRTSNVPIERTKSDWFLGYLQAVSAFLSKGKCCSFLQQGVNILDGLDEKLLRRLSEEILELASTLENV